MMDPATALLDQAYRTYGSKWLIFMTERGKKSGKIVENTSSQYDRYPYRLMTTEGKELVPLLINPNMIQEIELDVVAQRVEEREKAEAEQVEPIEEAIISVGTIATGTEEDSAYLRIMNGKSERK